MIFYLPLEPVLASRKIWNSLPNVPVLESKSAEEIHSKAGKGTNRDILGTNGRGKAALSRLIRLVLVALNGQNGCALLRSKGIGAVDLQVLQLDIPHDTSTNHPIMSQKECKTIPEANQGASLALQAFTEEAHVIHSVVTIIDGMDVVVVVIRTTLLRLLTQVGQVNLEQLASVTFRRSTTFHPCTKIFSLLHVVDCVDGLENGWHSNCVDIPISIVPAGNQASPSRNL